LNAIVDFVVRHGPSVLFGWVLLDQAGVPFPAVPLLLVVGALAGAGRLSLGLAVGAVVAGSLAADLVWYAFGRWRGTGVLGLLCRITLEPDSCVRRTEELFVAYRLRSLLIAKFLPGLNPLAAALSGVVGIRVGVFVLCEAAGALVWAAAWTGLGYLFSDLIDPIARAVSRLGGVSVPILLALLAGYVGMKCVQRRRFFRSLRMARISPETLKEMMDQESRPMMIVDLRTSVATRELPYTIPGALRITPEELEARHREIPRDAEIVLYCT
jgi:membrane protein DedA with SNARE-associated domain